MNSRTNRNYRRLLEESNLPIELAVEIADLLDKSGGPSDRDAVLEEAAKVCEAQAADQRQEAQQHRSRDHHKVAGELDQQAWGSKYCAEAIRALKNAAPQVDEGHEKQHVDTGQPPRAASEAGADDGYRVFKDGNEWCAVGKGFINLQESKAGFGHTPLVALGELIVEEGEV